MKAKIKDIKSLEYYLSLKYPVTIHPDPDGGFVAEIKELTGCLAQGETLEEVYKEIETARRLWIETSFEDRQEIPVPGDIREYSGKFILRVPKTLHRKLDIQAEKEGISLNQYVVSELSRVVGIREGKTTKYSSK
jgi:antitoxin HicB